MVVHAPKGVFKRGIHGNLITDVFAADAVGEQADKRNKNRSWGISIMRCI